MPKINGAHAIVYSTDAERDRTFLRDVLGLPHVDVGDGWLIFALPPAEVAVHPGEKNDVHELYLMTPDLDGLVRSLAKHGIACTPPRNLGWGILTQLSLPGGGRLGVYQPRHARPGWGTTVRKKTAARKRAAKPRAKVKAPRAKVRKGPARTRRTGRR